MKDKYRVIVWKWQAGEPFVHLQKIVKSYNTVIKMREKYSEKKFEVHSWPVNEKGEPIR